MKAPAISASVASTTPSSGVTFTPPMPARAARLRVRVKELKAPEAPAHHEHAGCGMQPGGALAKAGSVGVSHGFVLGPALSGADAALLQTGVPRADVEKALEPKLAGLVETFKGIHAHPELSEVEPNTAKLVGDRLAALGYTVTRDFGAYADPQKPIHSVVATLDNGPGPTLLIRADMDALPINEETDLPYKSTVPGVMHACGHDSHTTILLGTADLLMQMKDRWSGKLIFVGQPAEEKGTGGRAMVETGKLYEKFGRPDFAIGLHNHAEHAAGTVRVLAGYVMAAVDSVDVTMNGKGTHGAFPQLGVDPIVASGHFLSQVQTLVSRNTRPGEPGVVTVGTIHGGTARNVIPDRATMQLTIRSFSNEERKTLLDGVTRVANGVSAAAGAQPPTITPITDFSIPAVYNNPDLVTRLTNIWKSQKMDVGPMQQMMGGDDFTYFSANHSVPAVYFFVGSNDPKVIEAGGPIESAHTPRFKVMPEPTIKTGVVAMVTAATSLLAKPSA